MFVQAGGSPRGRAFAAPHADSVIAVATGVEGMKQYREDVRHHAVSRSVAIPMISNGLSDPGRDRRRGAGAERRLISSPSCIERALASTATVTNIDFSKYDLDQPLPRLTTNGELDRSTSSSNGAAGRRCGNSPWSGSAGLGPKWIFVGSPEAVTDRTANVMEQVDADGFLISTPFQRTSRRFIVEVTKGLIPPLQRRGLMRTAYSGRTLHQVLGQY